MRERSLYSVQKMQTRNFYFISLPLTLTYHYTWSTLCARQSNVTLRVLGSIKAKALDQDQGQGQDPGWQGQSQDSEDIQLANALDNNNKKHMVQTHRHTRTYLQNLG